MLVRYEIHSRHLVFSKFHEANIPAFKRLCAAWAAGLPEDRLVKFDFGYARPVDPTIPPSVRLTFSTNDKTLLDPFEAMMEEIDPCSLL